MEMPRVVKKKEKAEEPEKKGAVGASAPKPSSSPEEAAKYRASVQANIAKPHDQITIISLIDDRLAAHHSAPPIFILTRLKTSGFG